MKLKTTTFAILLMATFFSSFISCSPQSLDDIHEEQNIDKESLQNLPTKG